MNLRAVFLLPCALLAAAPAARAEATPTNAAPAGASTAAAPQLSVEAVYDFGRVAQGQPVTHTFKLSNTGTAELHISDVKPACGCTTAAEWPHSLAPGASGDLPIRLDTTHYMGALTKTVTIHSDDPAHPETVLELRGNVWTPVTVNNPVVIFPAATSPNETGVRSTTIRSEVEEPMTLSDAVSDNPHFKPSLKEIAKGKEYELSVALVPPLDDGTTAGRITIKTSIAKVPEVTVQAVVTLLAAVQVAPAQFSFSSQKLTKAEKRFAVVLNHRGVDLQVSDVHTDAPGVELSTNLSPDKKQHTITLNFPEGFELKPGQPYHLYGKTNQPAAPTFDIPILYISDR
jgi:hypothetical protein